MAADHLGLEALDDDVLALLRVEKEVPELESTKKAALFATVASRVGLLVPPADGSGGDGGGGDGGAGAVGQGSGGSGGSAFTLAGGKAIGALLATLAIGVVGGVALDRGLVSSSSSSSVPAPAMTIVQAAPSSLSSSVEEPRGVPVGALPSAPKAPQATTGAAAQHAEAPPTASPSSRGLAAERALLDVARGALARGEAGEALRATERHASEYPTGALVEEREAIAIKALVALGRTKEARVRLLEMERRFPNGLMLRAVKSAVEQAP
jgi:hypothetical protein